jgi:murein DD-endopeptidase MepM/ murein hydrolase activator NlpD/SH3-like domain-containing protein
MTFPRIRRALSLCALALGVAACEEVEQVQDRFRDMTPREAYLASLADAGLDQTALGRDWVAAGRVALDAAVPVSLPFQEEGFITPEDPGAMAYRVDIGRGRRLNAEVRLETDEGTQVFVDLLRLPEDAEDPLRPVVSLDSVPSTFEYEPWRAGEFILRLQPELLRGGRYRVVLRLEAQLAFPVRGYDDLAIQSVFGAPREGGRRSHNGVDIFARRGTPVLAAADGTVRRVEVTNLGGKVVWLRDPARRSSLYYAHLDSQAVRNGQEVRAGDIVGFVGNTGNARTTPPHLHFGIYRRGEGPVDPAPFLRGSLGTLAELAVDVGRLGSWVRLRSDGIRLRAAPGTRAPVVREMGRYTPLRVLGGSGDWYRVQLPDGGLGYVAARLTEPADRPLETRTAQLGATVLVQPNEMAPVLTELEAGARVPVLGRFDHYLYVRAPSGQMGWIGADGP